MAKRVRLTYVHRHECAAQGRKVVREYLAIADSIEVNDPRCTVEGPFFLTALERLDVEIKDI